MKRFLLSTALIAATTSGYANAGLLFSMERTGVSVDSPLLLARNDSPEEILSLRLTIGDETMNYGSAVLVHASPGLLPVLLHPDALNGLARSKFLLWDFDGFTTGREFSARLDIDRDNGPATVDWQYALFNNGDDVPNAVLHVVWANGWENEVTLQDEPDRDPLAPYVVHVPFSAVPEPSTLLLLASACATAAVARLRRTLRRRR